MGREGIAASVLRLIAGGYSPLGCTCPLFAFADSGFLSVSPCLSLSLPFAMRGRFGGAALLLQTRGIFEESDFLLACH